MSEAGVHRPHVAGIHGREDDGSYSIVLSGGYEDDKVRNKTTISDIRGDFLLFFGEKKFRKLQDTVRTSLKLSF